MNRTLKGIRRRFYLRLLNRAANWGFLVFLGAWAVNNYSISKLSDAISTGIMFFIIWALLFSLEAWWALRKERKLHEPHT